MSQPTPYSGRCSCKCRCYYDPAQHCHGICKECFLQWSTGSDTHAPAADNSYLGTYGLTNIWTGWIISKSPELAADTPAALLRPKTPPHCPLCDDPMARRPGAWKCYNLSHQQPVVILDQPSFPRSPNLNALGVCVP